MSINSRSFTRRLCVGISVVVAAVTGVGLAASAQSTSTAPPIIRRSEVAAAPARFVDIFPTAESTTPAIRLDAFENFSHRLVFSVVEKGSKRIKVLLPIRPNGVTGFVNTADVEVKTYDYFIRVDQSEHSLTVYKDGNPMFVDKVAVGKASTRTPNGRFYLTELAKVKNKGSEYGPYAFGLSAFSDTITRLHLIERV